MVPCPFIYSIANDFPGRQFTDTISDILTRLINDQITSASLNGISSDGVNVTIEFSGPISEAAKQTLDGNQSAPAGGLIARACWKLKISIEATPVPDNQTITQDADDIHSLTFDLQLL